MEVLLNDEDFAEQILNMPERPPAERFAEWSPERETLAQIVDALRNLTATTIAAAGAPPPQIDPAVRPITAADRVRARRRREAHESLVARVLPRS